VPPVTKKRLADAGRKGLSAFEPTRHRFSLRAHLNGLHQRPFDMLFLVRCDPSLLKRIGLNPRTCRAENSFACGTLNFLTHQRFAHLPALTASGASNVKFPFNDAATMQTLPRSLDNHTAALNATQTFIM